MMLRATRALFVLAALQAYGTAVASPLQTAADFLGVLSPPDGVRFRPDYQYYGAVRGWLKYHVMPASWEQARLSCHLEGAHLASPVTESLYAVMKEMLAEADSDTVYTGVHSVATQEDYYSEEGVHLREMPIRWVPGGPDNLDNAERCLALDCGGLAADVRCSSQRPFICYRSKDSVTTSNQCGTYDKGYLKGSSGNCYKYHAEFKDWFEAHRICTAEAAHLVVIDGAREAEELRVLFKKSKHETFIGVQNWHHWIGWMSLDGKSLSGSDVWSRWRKGEPNDVNGNEKCGTVVYSDELLLNDYPCNRTAPFVCEMKNYKASLEKELQ